MGSNMKKIEFTYGRKVMLIPNNVTVQSASFGVAEDDFFFTVTEYLARRTGCKARRQRA